jgi:hypothetical protein
MLLNQNIHKMKIKKAKKFQGIDQLFSTIFKSIFNRRFHHCFFMDLDLLLFLL